MGKPLAMGKGERFNNGQAPLRVAMGCEWGLGGGGVKGVRGSVLIFLSVSMGYGRRGRSNIGATFFLTFSMGWGWGDILT